MRALIIPARLPLKSLNTSSAVLGLYAPAPPSIQFLRSIRVSSRVRVSTRGLRKLQFFESPQMGGEIGQAKMWGFCLGFFPLQLLLIYSLFFFLFPFFMGVFIGGGDVVEWGSSRGQITPQEVSQWVGMMLGKWGSDHRQRCWHRMILFGDGGKWPRNGTPNIGVVAHAIAGYGSERCRKDC